MANILVVDDEVDMEPLMRQWFRREVQAGKITFYFALDGAQALAIMDARPDIDLVITDINMPGMDGLTLLERLSEHGDTPPMALIVSAYGDLANIRAGMNRGAFDFVTKPIAFADLELTINRALEKGRMERAARAAQARVLEMQKEFELARRVQAGILPQPWPRGGAEEFVAFIRSAQAVGGDAYDFIPIDVDHVGFAIADVAGKGIAAAMMAAVTNAFLLVLANDLLDPAACLAKLNRFVTANNPERLFVTLLYCVLDRRSGVVTYANAGHPWPMKLDAEGLATPLIGKIGAPVGVTDNAAWTAASVMLKPGERLFLFTDGLTEASNASGELYGEERLRARLQAPDPPASGELIRQLIADIDQFVGAQPVSDDMTCLMLEWRGRDPSANPEQGRLA